MSNVFSVVGSFFRIGSALMFGAVLVGGAFVWSTQKNNAETNTLAVAYTPVENTTRSNPDSDGDGVYDWEEDLAELKPRVASSSAQYEVPETVTGQFALRFFEDYVRTSGGREIDAQTQAAFVENAARELASATQYETFQTADIQTHTDTSFSAIREYGNEAASAIQRHSRDNESEAVILARALDQEDPEILKDLAPIKTAYGNMVRDLQAVVAPRTLASAHLDLLNALKAIENDIDAMQQAFADPLYAMPYIERYQTDAANLYYAIDAVRTKLEAHEITYTQEEAGAFFFSLRP